MAAPFRWRLLERAGEGAAAVVWRATDTATGAVGAIKIAKDDSAVVAAEAAVLARAARRWGPSLLDAGTIPEGVPGALAGAAYVVTEWVAGAPLDRVEIGKDAQKTAAIVAHGVGRALAEIHAAGVRHGDVKPANILLAPRAPARDAAAARGATLVDLSVATALGHALTGATPKYLAPEATEGRALGPAADLYALGVVLSELGARGEPAAWARALLARAPGGRPSAAWIADRAACFLGLREDRADAQIERIANVRRAYLAVRAREIAPGARVAQALTGEPRAWLEGAIAAADAVARARGDAAVEGREIGELAGIGRLRWLVALVGPAAASWPLDAATSDAALAAKLIELARERAPSAWTLDDLRGRAAATRVDWSHGSESERAARLARELARPYPDAAAIAAVEDALRERRAPETLAIELASVLLRAGESGRAWAALAGARGAEVDALRAEIARRRGDAREATTCAERAARSADARAAARARATLGRLAWDAGDDDRAASLVDGVPGAAAAEVRALVAVRRGAIDEGLRAVDEAILASEGGDEDARLQATRGLLEHAAGASPRSLVAFGQAAQAAARAGAVVEEATYATGEAAAAADAGQVARAIASATRAALLWERLGRPQDAARAWLSRAAALAAIGGVHAADEAAEEARARAEEAGDARAAAFARWAHVEARAPGDARARGEAIAADGVLAACAASDDDRARAAARLLVWAPDAIDDARVRAIDALSLSPPARWEWWGARAAAILAGRARGDARSVLAALRGTLDVPAPIASRGPALDAAMRLALEEGDGEAAQRFDEARRAAARALFEGTPPELGAQLAHVPWARAPLGDAPGADVGFAPGQVARLEAIVRALATRDRLRPLLEQVLDTLVLWTGVERGLLLLRAPDGRLVPRAARNLARKDLAGEQLALSQSIARRAMESGDAVVATDAFATMADVHASVHALRLRSVLAVPLVARGETLGVVYLDDRARRGAFGDRELAWVRVVASQAAMAIADARDHVLLRRAARRAERATKRVEELLSDREAELDRAQAELRLARAEPGGLRFDYDAIVGRSDAMRAALKIVDRVTATDVPVLLVGESGTGKELIARAIHVNGTRARRAFVGENCASVPETLLESTLFGHVRGAFTGASSARAGLFDVADGGTLFLDEIGEMPLAMQTKLLRVLQDGEVRAVGADRSHRVDVRVIAATHRDLEAMVARGAFREDLFYRLNVISVRVPPLRERGGDVPALVAHFLKKHGGDDPPRVTRAAMEKLAAYAWPGNVRQLENEIRRAVVLAEGRIDTAELSPEIARGGPRAARAGGLDLRSRVDALEAELLRDALATTRGNQTRAAHLLGLSRFGLQKMMKRLGVENG